MYTLHVVHAVLLGLLTAVTVANCLLHRRSRGVRWFAVYIFYAFLGALLVLLRGRLPASLSLVVGAMLFPLAYAMLYRSMTEFFGRGRDGWWLQLVLAASSVPVLIVWGLLVPDTGRRLLWFSLILASQLLVTAVYVFRHAGGSVRGSAWVMGGVLLLLATSNLLRAASVGLWGAPREYALGASNLNWAVLVNSVLQAGLVIAFVWMTAAALRGELEVQASTDSLTGLLNRRAIERVALACQARGCSMSAILIDLDGFKQINDRYGHHAGDTVLQLVAHCLLRDVRAEDRVARMGGDEFAIVLPGADLPTAIAVGERLRSSLADLVLETGRDPIRVGASFGVAELRHGADDWRSLMEDCDRALYTVKSRGGNQVVFQ